jgi:hypothetical protein
MVSVVLSMTYSAFTVGIKKEGIEVIRGIIVLLDLSHHIFNALSKIRGEGQNVTCSVDRHHV